MAAEILVGAAVGAALGELLKAVLEMKDKAIMFRKTLANVETTLTTVDRVIKDIEQRNNDFRRPKEELEQLNQQMKEGTKLVKKCCRIHRLNFCDRIRCQEQLAELAESLMRFFMIEMLAKNARDSEETLFRLTRIQSDINKLVRTIDTTASSVPVKSSQIERYEETTESETLESASTLPVQDAAGTDCAEQVMEDITSLSHKVSQAEANVDNIEEAEPLMSEKQYDELHADGNIFKGSANGGIFFGRFSGRFSREAAVGAAFGELLKAVLEMKDKAIMFRKTLANIETTLTTIDPVMKHIEQHDNQLGRTKEELKSLIKQMEEGKKLVYKCSKIQWYNFLARSRHEEQLAELVEALVRFFIIDMQAQTARDLKEILVTVTGINSAVNKLPLVSIEDTNTMGSPSDFAPAPVEREEANESETFDSMSGQPATDAAGTNSDEQVMDDITSLLQKVSQTEANVDNSQAAEHLRSEKSYDEKKFKASLLGGAVEAAIGELLKAVLETKDKAVMFKPTLAYLRATLTAIDPVIKEIQLQNNIELGRPKEELELLIREMEEGTKLVYKCSKINKFNFLARIRYQEQLAALVESLVRFFMIDMQAQNARDLRETLLKVRRIHSAANKLPLVSTQDATGLAIDDTRSLLSDSDAVPAHVSESDP